MIVAGALKRIKISPRRSEEFSVNRPFLYVIVAAQRGDKIDNSNPLILFIGRIFTPVIQMKRFTFA